MKIDFTKMNGLGNDFVIIDARHQSVNLTEEQIIKLADRNNSITKGCDQLIMLEPSKKADVFMRIYNTDGSEAQACGNATRCIATLLIDKNNNEVNIETVKRILPCILLETNGTDIIVNMGKANSYEKIDLGSEYAELGKAISVNVDNPHCVFIVDDGDKITDDYLAYWGPKIENHEKFLPERTNVEFVSQISFDEFRIRVWERGAGITKACGSGAMAVAWALYKASEELSFEHYTMQMDGGFVTMTIEKNKSITMIGDTELEFANSVEIEL